ncbi:hypothetical protein AALO_G00032950 [Alosa alosa]|uniref:Uncharacterized protein n=1 Tax=Alosa alosa TaxID=278164 RepID=A0AAV6HCK6_9TELE|nr:hypothetical protein AALO_G00032950 [Alosa alosa]
MGGENLWRQKSQTFFHHAVPALEIFACFWKMGPMTDDLQQGTGTGDMNQVFL